MLAVGLAGAGTVVRRSAQQPPPDSYLPSGRDYEEYEEDALPGYSPDEPLIRYNAGVDDLLGERGIEFEEPTVEVETTPAPTELPDTEYGAPGTEELASGSGAPEQTEQVSETRSVDAEESSGEEEGVSGEDDVAASGEEASGDDETEEADETDVEGDAEETGDAGTGESCAAFCYPDRC